MHTLSLRMGLIQNISDSSLSQITLRYTCWRICLDLGYIHEVYVKDSTNWKNSEMWSKDTQRGSSQKCWKHDQHQPCQSPADQQGPAAVWRLSQEKRPTSARAPGRGARRGAVSALFPRALLAPAGDSSPESRSEWKPAARRPLLAAACLHPRSPSLGNGVMSPIWRLLGKPALSPKRGAGLGDRPTRTPRPMLHQPRAQGRRGGEGRR